MSNWDNQENGPMRPGFWDNVAKTELFSVWGICITILGGVLLVTNMCIQITEKTQSTNKKFIEMGYEQVPIINERTKSLDGLLWQAVRIEDHMRSKVWEE